MKEFCRIIVVLVLTGFVAQGCGTLSRLLPGLAGNGAGRTVPSGGGTAVGGGAEYGGGARNGGTINVAGTAGADTLVTRSTIGSPEEITIPSYEELSLTALQRRLIRTAKGKIGCRYQYAGKGPNSFDCSGFTGFVFGKEGIRLSPSSMAQYSQGRAVGKREPLHPCDLVFFSGRRISGTVGHVGMVLDYDRRTGEFTFIHASVGNGVEIQHSSADYYARRYIGARRILTDDGMHYDTDPSVYVPDVDIPEEPEQTQPVEQWHTIKSGDTLSAIAKRYHTSVSAICRLNGIKETTILQIGRKLRIK